MSSILASGTIVASGEEVVETRTARRKRLRLERNSDPAFRGMQAATRRRMDQLRRQVEAVVCSATWAEDCLYRGANYAPDFRCKCALCRIEFPDRLHPRQARESNISVDCQGETEEDPDLAEDLARLRNDRARVGSVFVGMRRANCRTPPRSAKQGMADFIDG